MFQAYYFIVGLDLAFWSLSGPNRTSNIIKFWIWTKPNKSILDELTFFGAKPGSQTDWSLTSRSWSTSTVPEVCRFILSQRVVRGRGEGQITPTKESLYCIRKSLGYTPVGNIGQHKSRTRLVVYVITLCFWRSQVSIRKRQVQLRDI